MRVEVWQLHSLSDDGTTRRGEKLDWHRHRGTRCAGLAASCPAPPSTKAATLGRWNARGRLSLPVIAYHWQPTLYTNHTSVQTTCCRLRRTECPLRIRVSAALLLLLRWKCPQAPPLAGRASLGMLARKYGTTYVEAPGRCAYSRKADSQAFRGRAVRSKLLLAFIWGRQ